MCGTSNYFPVDPGPYCARPRSALRDYSSQGSNIHLCSLYLPFSEPKRLSNIDSMALSRYPKHCFQIMFSFSLFYSNAHHKTIQYSPNLSIQTSDCLSQGQTYSTHLDYSYQFWTSYIVYVSYLVLLLVVISMFSFLSDF